MTINAQNTVKSTFIFNLLAFKKLRPMPKRVILFYPVELDQSPVNWDEDLDIPVEYQPGLPTRPEFWKSIESGTLCVIDDLYDKDGS